MRWLFLDRITEMVPGERAQGLKGVASSEDYFVDHFPKFPVVPGVIQVEALAQLSGKLIEITLFEEQQRWIWPILSMVRKAKFRKFVRPGDVMQMTTELLEIREESAICRTSAKVDGKITTQAELLFVFNPERLETDEAQRDLERMERGQLKILWDEYEDWCARSGADPNT